MLWVASMDMGADVDALGCLPGEAAGGGFSPMAAAWKSRCFGSCSQSPRWIYRCLICLLHMSYLIFCTCRRESLLPPLKRGPQNAYFSPRWRAGVGNKRDLAVLSIPRATNLLLQGIFLSSNQWKCIYQENVLTWTSVLLM